MPGVIGHLGGRHRYIAAALGILGSFAIGGAAHAATSQTTFQVLAHVDAACNVSAGNLDFGAYDPLSGSNKDGQSAVLVTCTNGTTYNVGLNVGAGSGATTAVRKMTITGGGTETLNYSLYRDSNRSQLWGESIGSNTVAGTGNGAQQSIDVFGRSPASQTAKPGSYLDTITVTVTF